VLEGPDGSIYFTEKSSHVVRRVMPDGTIATAAGTGVAGYSGDGGAASRAQLNQPDGLALGLDGSVYVADQGNHRVRRIAPSGLITTVAGTGTLGFAGDAGQATQARLNRPQGLEVALDGTLYIADSNNNRIRKVAADGVITTDAGNGTAGYSAEGAAATDTRLNRPRGVMRGSDGTLYVADFGNSRIRRIAPDFPGLTETEFAVSGASGAEAYVFDAAGRHLRTVSSRTGATLLTFGYDPAGRLASVDDARGRTTRVERDAAGAPVAIVAPSGQRTALVIDESGTLEGVTNPGGETTRLGYAARGLLTRLTDPRGGTHTFTYDAQGRLVEDGDPSGGTKTLARTELPGGGYEVGLTTREGRSSRFRVETLPSGAERRTRTGPDGLSSTTLVGTDGSVSTTSPDGTVTTATVVADPSWGMQAPVAQNVVVSMPSGLQHRTSVERRATFTTPGDLLSLATMTDRVTVNGQTRTLTYDAAALSYTLVSPLGRVSSARTDSLGRPIESSTPGVAPVRYTYDAAGRITRTAQGARTTTLGYDAAGRLASTTDALGRTERYRYDAANRLVAKTFVDGREVGFGYDAAGNMVRISPPGRPGSTFAVGLGAELDSATAPAAPGVAGTVTRFVYDRDHRLVRSVQPDGRTVGFAYDGSGRLATMRVAEGDFVYRYVPASGNLLSVTAPGGTTNSYEYDGVLPRRETWSGGVAGSVDVGYNSDLRVATQSVNGAAVDFRYDADGLLTGAGALTLERAPSSVLLTGSTLAGVTTRLGYDMYGAVAADTSLAGSGLLIARSYTRDALGRIVGLAESVGGATSSYTMSYDSAGRLASVERDGVALESHSYDDNGNRTRATAASGTVEAVFDDQDRLLSYGQTSYGYTDNGDLATRVVGNDTTRFAYDVLGNLRTVRLPDASRVEYVIDGQNRRVGARVNGALVQGFLYAGRSQVAELDGAGNVVSRFVYGSRPNVPDYMARGGKTYRIVTDHLGSVRMVVDAASGEVAQRVDYDSFRRVVQDSNPGFSRSASPAGCWTGAPGSPGSARATTTPPRAGGPPKTRSASRVGTPTCTATFSTIRSTSWTPWGSRSTIPVPRRARISRERSGTSRTTSRAGNGTSPTTAGRAAAACRSRRTAREGRTGTPSRGTAGSWTRCVRCSRTGWHNMRRCAGRSRSRLLNPIRWRTRAAASRSVQKR
jgi:YD repeat-containing protein